MTDVELIKQIKKGNNKCFTELYNKYYKIVLNTFIKNVKNKSDIDDLVQITFIKVFHNIDKYKKEFTFNTWITSISYNVLLDYFRKRKRLPLLLNSKETKSKEVFNENFQEEITPESLLINKQWINFLYKIIGKLTGKKKEVLEKRIIRNMKYKEIAKDLGVTIGTVKSQYFYARQQLIKLLNSKK